eukprot:COSAG03_NODE_987_length_5098_cov_24.705341_4_plen_174_part_00
MVSDPQPRPQLTQPPRLARAPHAQRQTASLAADPALLRVLPNQTSACLVARAAPVQHRQYKEVTHASAGTHDAPRRTKPRSRGCVRAAPPVRWKGWILRRYRYLGYRYMSIFRPSRQSTFDISPQRGREFLYRTLSHGAESADFRRLERWRSTVARSAGGLPSRARRAGAVAR